MGWMRIKYTQHIYYVHGNTYESQSRKNTSMSSEQASRLIYIYIYINRRRLWTLKTSPTGGYDEHSEVMAYLKMAYLLKMVIFHGYVKQPDGTWK